MSALSTAPPILTIWARRRSGADDAHQVTYQLLCRYCPAGFSAGGGVAGFSVVGAGVAGLSCGVVGVGVAGVEGGVVADFSGATVVGCPGDVLVSDFPCGVNFFSFSGALTFFSCVGGACFLLHPLNVNATNAITANAVRATLLMVIPFRKIFHCTVRCYPCVPRPLTRP
jgi:hypothetical protein